MRSVSIEIAGEQIEMPVSYAAGSALAKAGYDPLREALNARRIRDGEIEDQTSAEKIIKILYVGIHASGSKLTIEQIGEAVFEAGVMEYLAVAARYISEFVTPGPEHPVGSKSSGEAPAA